MRLLTTAILAVFLCLNPPAQALAAPTCVAPVGDLIATARAKGIRIETIAPEKVPGFLARLRKLFPDRVIMADEIIAARKPEGHGTAERGLVYLMLVKGGCVISAALVDRESFKMLNGEPSKPEKPQGAPA